ncbi:phosphoglycerate dehydrogenase-like enzyme [Cupriavidus gilardii J11]|uniref:Phosphoglycerate dehydrogenase-like enzyme n=1 Tax=Cupriavidus gilardii J11 TaxID=936133 RepID=A0A562BPM5_9BURK|nr:NAD(P)-dependent oxidoreductase [Cupriavidus gilardii]TWG87238.1 phosphoglycerate dehydrogenase-like enzyme [Cupriavidus gilardii J11]
MTASPSPTPLRILLSAAAARAYAKDIDAALEGRLWTVVPAPAVGDDTVVDADIAFVSRDVTGLSTKHELQPATARFYNAMLQAPSLRWVHVHSAGADRPVYVRLRERGVTVTTSSGANAAVVAQTALAGLLALARQFPQLMAAQRERRWAPLIGSGLPRDLDGQTATIVGWGPIGQQIGAVLKVLGLKVVVVRQSAAQAGPDYETTTFAGLADVLPRTDWLVLACPLTDDTRGLIDAAALARLPGGARLVNVSRGEVVDEAALIAALRDGQLAGAYLDVYAHEPLPVDSPLWDMPNVIATPHSAGFSDGNAARVVQMFLTRLREWGR